MDKEDALPIHNGILLSHKKNEILPYVATWMDQEIIILSEVNQTKKDQYYGYQKGKKGKRDKIGVWD